jgi:hypothetical protein
LTGSIYGGTYLIIQGTNFGKEITDNPVELSYLDGIGSAKCLLESTSPTEIKCRIDTSKTQKDGQKAKVNVFLKTSEEAECDSSICDGFVFTATVPKVSAAVTEYSGPLKSW